MSTPSKASSTAPSPLLVVAATNRPHSLTHTVASHYVEVLGKHRIAVELLSLVALAPDFIATALYANKGKDSKFNALAHKVEQANKCLFVVPQYHGSFPGVFKTFIDGLDVIKAFRGKKCALVGVSKGYQGCIMGLSHLTDIFHYLGMSVYPMQPKFSMLPDASLATLKEHTRYLALIEEQVKGFIDF